MRAHTFERILVPVDFSEIAAHALRTASLLAARCGHADIVAMYANWLQGAALLHGEPAGRDPG